MAFLAQLTDLHLRSGELGPAARSALDAAVRTVLDLPFTPDAVVVTGDLADTGHPDEYAAVFEALGRLAMPVHVIPGNHDDRDALTWPDSVAFKDARLVLCDTSIPGHADGHIDTERLAHTLAEAPDTTTIVAMHHPPLLVGIPALDAIGLASGDRENLEQVLRANPQVARVISGHVHRLTQETLGGCGVVTGPSTHLQIEFDPSEPDGMRFVERGRGIMLHHVRGTGVVSHFQTTE